MGKKIVYITEETGNWLSQCITVIRPVEIDDNDETETVEKVSE